jgi:spoIIIJ-associated protein
MDTARIKSIIEETLRLMKISYDAVEIAENQHTHSPKLTIKTGDSAILIGIRGANLLAFNHIIKKIASRGKEDDDESTKFFVDVNNYQEKLEEELKNKARIMSERARSFKTDIELEPMSSYERMIIHSCLQNIPDIKTESKGEGRERRVVIKYVESQ